GEHQRLSPYLALKGVTDWAAYQIKEEKSKGTLTVGKLADLVILEKNPLKTNPDDIATIQVMETIKEGKSIFKFSPTIAMIEAPLAEHRHDDGPKQPLSAKQQQLIQTLMQRAK
ncbi:MAG: amidohydrolase family protein, partial [bacterium]